MKFLLNFDSKICLNRLRRNITIMVWSRDKDGLNKDPEKGFRIYI
jgi:hypothetical protein